MSDINMQIKDHNGTSWDALYPKTKKEQIAGLETELADIKAIAEGASRARAFATTAAANTWLATPANVAELKVGDNFYIQATNEPDYWWDGSGLSPLAGESVNIVPASASQDGTMSKEDFSKLAGIAPGANNYTHPSGDGNLHVPATGTSSDGKVLKAGAGAGSAAWASASEANLAAAVHQHNAIDLNINTITVGLTAPANPKNGDVWFDYNNN